MNVLLQHAGGLAPAMPLVAAGGKPAGAMSGWQRQLERTLLGARGGSGAGHGLPEGRASGRRAAQEGPEPGGLALPPGLPAAPWRPVGLDTEDVAPGARPAPPTQDAPVTAAQRVHVETAVDGWTVWLGVDGGPAQVSAHAAAVVCELRRSLQGSAQRLAMVVCNGRTVYLSPTAGHAQAGAFSPTALRDPR